MCSRERLDLPGEVRNARLRFNGFRMCNREAGLELIAKGGELGQEGLVGERHTETRLVVAQLGLRDRQVLPDALAFRSVDAHEPLCGVEDGSRSMVFAREPGSERRCPVEIEIGRKVPMQHQSEPQAAKGAQREALRLADELRCIIQQLA